MTEADTTMQHNRLTLAFTGKDRHLERSFLNQYCLRNLRFIRMCLYFSIIAYSSIGLLDTILFPIYKHTLWLIRYSIVLPVFAASIYLTYTRCYPVIWQYCHFTLILVTGIGAVVMSLIIPPPGNLRYMEVVVMVLFLNYALIRARFITAALAGGIVYITYVLAVHATVSMPWEIRLTNSYYLTMVVIVGMFISYAIEKSERVNYYLSCQLNGQKEEVEQVNRNLEQRVKERTKELEHQIEERQRAEKAQQTLEGRLRQSQKMDAIGTLAGGIAHDFNNVLSAMIGYTELIRDMQPSKDPKTLQNVEEILKAGNRAKNLIRQILTFSRQNEQEVAPVQIDIIVKEVSRLMKATLPSTVKIRRHIRSNAMVMADPTQIHQVIMNLCTNAAYAMQDNGGELTISLTETEIDADFAAQHPPLKPGAHILLRVSDTGIGIADELKERIFEPFFTTKKPGQGTGLGLSVVHGIVKNYNGATTVYSEPGQGATFNVYLPVTACRENCQPLIELSQLRGKERILYVDDEKQIATMTYFKLTNLGYRVTVMTDSLAAWDYFESDPAAVDMLITDMTMPGLTGIDLAKKTLDLRPDLPIILCTGLGKVVDDQTHLKNRLSAVLTKPIFTREIAVTIRRIFEAKQGVQSVEK